MIQKCNELRSNSKKLWQMVNNVIGKNNDERCTVHRLKVDNIETSNAEQIVNSLAQRFSTVGKVYATKIKPSTTEIKNYLSKIWKNEKSIFLVSTHVSEVETIIDGIVNKTYSGWDGLLNKLLKSIKAKIVYQLCIILNKPLAAGVFPIIMKHANVTPLHKGGPANVETNYRPISLLPAVSKIIEKALYARIYKFLPSTNQLYNSQYSHSGTLGFGT